MGVKALIHNRAGRTYVPIKTPSVPAPLCSPEEGVEILKLDAHCASPETRVMFFKVVNAPLPLSHTQIIHKRVSFRCDVDQGVCVCVCWLDVEGPRAFVCVKDCEW